jgi:DNA-binding transcriptional ArsR family regulator
MAKDITQYFSNVAPIASAGGVMTPYREAPPMTPINIESDKFAAMGKLGKAFENIGEDFLKIKALEDDHNEKIIGNKVVNDANLKMIEALNLHQQNNRGTNAMLPGFVDEAKQIIEENNRVALEGVKGLSKTNQDAVSIALSKLTQNGLLTAIEYQKNQRHRVEDEIVLTDYLKTEQAIKNGADPTTAIANHMKVVERTKPGDTELAKLNAQRLSIYAVEAETNIKETNIILDLQKRHKGDIDAIIKEVESPEFLEKHGKKIQQDIRADVTSRAVIQERQYKQYAEQKVGAAAVKIYKGKKITLDDTKGLRPSELADIEKIQDYQIRQNRAEYRFANQEARLLAVEKSNRIAGEIQAKILNGDEIDRLEIYKQVPNGLDIIQANTLVAMADKVNGDPKYKDGMALIKTAFKNGVIKADDYKATTDKFKQMVDAAGADANAVKIANDLINPKKPNAIAEWLDGAMRYMGENYNAKFNKDMPQVKTITIDGKKYKDGDIIKKDGKSYRVRVK